MLNDRPFTADDVRAAVTARTSAAVVQQASPGVAFPHVRAALADACGVPPNRVRPSARLDDLLPRRGRAVAVWRLRELLPEVPLEVAGMSAAAVVTMLLLIGLLYAVGVPVVQAVDNAARAADIGRSWWVIPYALAGMVVVPAVFVGGMGLAVAASLWLWRNHLPVRIPADCATAGDLARYLARRGHWNQVVPVPADPWPAVRAAVAAAAGRRPFEVARDTRLADLGFPPAGPG